jgi:hypothetical protein
MTDNTDKSLNIVVSGALTVAFIAALTIIVTEMLNPGLLPHVYVALAYSFTVVVILAGVVFLLLMFIVLSKTKSD